jgi:hypothetical protein
MPGVGITDARQILGLVVAHRAQVGLSVALQLLSAACYAPALIGAVAQPSLGSDRAVCSAAALLLVGAMGSAADAVFHLLAYAMSAPDLDATGFVPLMAFVQGPGLRFILPLVAAFFAGSLWLSIAFARRRLVPLWNPWLFAVAVAVAVIGRTVGTRAGIAPRAVGLAVLAVVVAAQVGAGVGLARVNR